jgi:UDP-N-acetylmuramoyl-L-alanyl-D-glutamate--2,6-diaminopimelate ligase
LHSNLLGRFNLSNLLAVFTVLGIYNFSEEAIFSALANVQGVNGRMQLLGGGDKAHVVIDYAHTPDALKQVLMTLRDYTQRELWCVFGCGGNRDQGKRSQMGQIAENLADNVIITDDNPRQEDPNGIISDILQGMSKPERAVIEHNRRRAIAHAIHCAKTDDIILIAGKGHENNQIYSTESLPFSDEIEVQLLLAEKT